MIIAKVDKGGGSCYTPCPFEDKAKGRTEIKVGSGSCYDCRYFIRRDALERDGVEFPDGVCHVYCMLGETPRVIVTPDGKETYVLENDNKPI